MKKSSLLLVLSSLALISCGESSSSIFDNSQEESTTSGSVISASIPDEEEEEYVIKIVAQSNVTITSSKEKAKQGETITLTVSVDDGFKLVALLMNGEALTVINNQATFIMPNESATISATLSVDGDVTLQGGLVGVLKEEVKGSGLYVARNIKVSGETPFSFVVGNQALSMSDVDPNKCFASISSNYGHTKTGTYDENLRIAGGATYDFYYDDNADVDAGRCYVKKVSQDALPSDVGSFGALFDGQARSESTMNVDGVSSISYSNGITDTKYEYTNFTNGSKALVTKLSNGSSKGVVSKKIKDNVYSVVDTYVEYGENYATGLNSSSYSSKYAIVDLESSVADGYSKFQKARHEAEFEAHKFSHGLESLRFDIMDAYYIGFDSSTYGTDGLGLFDRKVVSTAKAKGFDVALDSYREIDTSNSTNVSDSDKETSYYLYDVDISFDKAGRPLSGTYVGKKFGKDAYDFSTHTLIDPTKFTTIGDLSFTFTYGDATKENDFDDTSYFTSSLTAAIYDENLGEDYKNKNAIQLKSSDTNISSYLTLTSDKTTALDLSNFVIMASSDTSVIGPRNTFEPFYFVTKKGGKAILTIGNPALPELPSVQIEVEVVANITVRGFYMTGENGMYTSLLQRSDAFTIETGCKYKFRVYGSPKDVDVPFSITADKDLIDISVTYEKDGHYYITYDARKAKVTSQETIKVTLDSPYYGEGESKTVFTVYLLPGKSIDPIGTWYAASSYDDNGNPTGYNSKIVANIKEYDATKASETMSSIVCNNVTYNFSFSIDSDTNSWKIGNKKSSSLSFNLMIDETDNGYLGIALQTEGSWGGMDSITEGEDVLGSMSYDDETGEYSAQYQIFVPSSFKR